jgi:hypothetical protein
MYENLNNLQQATDSPWIVPYKEENFWNLEKL